MGGQCYFHAARCLSWPQWSPAGFWLLESHINNRMSPCIGKVQSLAQMCLERKSLFECARQSFKVIVKGVFRAGFSASPLTVGVQSQGGEEEVSRAGSTPWHCSVRGVCCLSPDANKRVEQEMCHILLSDSITLERWWRCPP